MTNGESQGHHSAGEIKAEIASLRREIDDLRALAKPDKPWYRDGTLLLALVAFLFTLITYRRQDVHDTRVELRNVLKDLDALPVQDAEAETKFNGTPFAMTVSGGFANQAHVLSKQAYDLAEHLGGSLDDSERVAVAVAIQGTEPELAEKILIARVISSGNPDDFIAAQRVLGGLEVTSGRVALGDKNFQSAEDLFKSPSAGLGSMYILSSNTMTEENWTRANIQVGACDNAAAHLAAALKYY